MRKIFFSLLLKSTKLKAAIEAEQKRPLPDWMRLFRLKRLRLKLKDRLLALSNQVSTPQLLQPIYVHEVQNRSHRRFIATSRSTVSQGGRS